MTLFKRVFTSNQTMRLMRDLADSLGGLSPDKKYALEIKEHKEKRSLDANAYAWEIISEIAKAMGVAPNEVYRSAIKKSGGTFVVQPVKNEALEQWSRVWCKGTGWMVDILGPAKKLEGYTVCQCWYGSSVFDTAEMSHLIDNLVQDAKALGIDTSTPEERQRYLEAWDEKQTD